MDKIPCVTIDITSAKKILTPENIKEQFEHQRIDENLYHKAVCYNEMIGKEELQIDGTNEELILCRDMLRFVFSQIPDHLKRQWVK
jgi:hypothetical protein